MRRIAVGFFVVSLAATVAFAHTDVTPAEVKAMLDAGGDVTVVDVRELSEYCDSTYTPPGHIPGAINMPWNSGYLEEHYNELPPDHDIVVVCRSGGRSNAAANFLDGVGFASVFDMLGGMNAWPYETELCGPASIPGTGAGPVRLALEPAKPNPFTDETEIVYASPAGRTAAALSIYDSRGRLVARLGGYRTEGTHRVVWTGRDDRGRPVSSGVYFYRLTWNGESVTRRVVLVK